MVMLHLASSHKQLPVVRYLVEDRASINAVNGRGRTPLAIAAPARQAGIIHYLQRRGAQHNNPVAPQNNPRYLPAKERRRHGFRTASQLASRHRRLYKLASRHLGIDCPSLFPSWCLCAT